MSYIIVKYKKSIEKKIEGLFPKFEVDLVKITSNLFNKKPEEIIVDFESFNSYEGNRDIIIRAETSDKNSELLQAWSEEIKIIFNCFCLKGLKIGIKTYCLNSYWQEITVE